MNDFTKEELKEIMHCVYAYRDLCDEDIEDALCDKILSMIDNYCDHKETCPNYDTQTQCKNCGLIIN